MGILWLSAPEPNSWESGPSHSHWEIYKAFGILKLYKLYSKTIYFSLYLPFFFLLILAFQKSFVFYLKFTDTSYSRKRTSQSISFVFVSSF